MSREKITIRIAPTPATQNLGKEEFATLARMTKLDPGLLRERFSRGKAIKVATVAHPKIVDLIHFIKSLGFIVTVGRRRSPSRPESTSVPTRSVFRPKEETEWKVGDIFEHLYQVRDIKHGGMGAVYLVRHLRWNTMLAVKSLHKRLRESEEDQALFIKEAETWIDIGFHPNIAACYYVRKIEGSPRIFIEYVGERALNAWLTRHRGVGRDKILDLMIQFCDGLHHAHSKGLVHRDIKPGNCMMTEDGVLKITDFGLTKRSGTSIAADDTTTVELSTQTVDLPVRESVTAAGMGTPGYMAPEMWSTDGDVGPQADIYAFGIMLFEISCGRKPFVARGPQRHKKLALAHFRQAPPLPTSIRPDTPPKVEEIILKCLKKRPQDRYASARELRSELVAAYEEITGTPYPRQEPDEVKLRADAWNNRALSLIDLGHNEEAAAALENALKTDPNHPEAVYNTGLLEWANSGNPGWDLIVKMEEIVKTDEYRSRAARLLGRCLLNLGEAPRAVKAFETAIVSDASTTDEIKPYAIALTGNDQDTEAVEHLLRYLQSFPNDQEARGWLIGALFRLGRLKEAELQLGSVPEDAEIAGLAVREAANLFRFSGLSEKAVFTGHKGWITCLTFFPRSRAVATGSRDRTVMVWDSESREAIKTIRVPEEPPARLWVSPDERTIVVASARSGAPVTVLDVDSSTIRGKLPAQEGLLTAVGFSPDSAQILTVEQRGVVRLWDAHTLRAGVKFGRIPPHTAADLVFNTEHGLQLFLGGTDRMVKRIVPSEGQDGATLRKAAGPQSDLHIFEKGHSEPIVALTVSPDGSLVLTSSRDKTAMIWDARAGSLLTAFTVHRDQIDQVALNPRMPLVATYESKAGMKVWNSHTGMVERSPITGETEILCLQFSSDGQTLGAGGKDMNLRFWDVSGRMVRPDLALAKIRPVTKQMESDQEFKSTLGQAKKAALRGSFRQAYQSLRRAQSLPGYERSDLVLDAIQRMKDHGTRTGLLGGWQKKAMESGSGIMEVSFSPSAITFLTAQGDHTIRMWSSTTGECVKTLAGHTNLVTSLAFSANGREAVSGSDDRTVRTWELQTGRSTRTLKGHSDVISSVAYSRGGSMIASGSWDKTVRLWNSSDGSLYRTLKGHDGEITSVAFFRADDVLVSAGFEGSVKMWKVSSGRLLRDLKVHDERITSMEISPKSNLFLTGSTDGTAQLWDAQKGRELRTFGPHDGGIRDVAFSPDQRFALTACDDTIVRLWDVNTGECIRDFQGHAREITAVEFASNGRFFLSASADGVALIWELDWEWDFTHPDKNAQ